MVRELFKKCAFIYPFLKKNGSQVCENEYLKSAGEVKYFFQYLVLSHFISVEMCKI